MRYIAAMGSLLPMLATFLAVHPLAAVQHQYEAVPIYGTLKVMVGTTYNSGARAPVTISGSEAESFEVTYSGFDEGGKQIMTIHAIGSGEATSEGAGVATHCRGALAWERTRHEAAVAEVNLAEHRYRIKTELSRPMGEVDCTTTNPYAPPQVSHHRPEIGIHIPSNVDGKPIELAKPGTLLLDNPGPEYETGTLAGAWNGTSASGSYALDEHLRVARSWVSQEDANAAATMLQGPESVVYTIVYWHLSLKPIEPCIAKITFASGDIKFDGEPAYEIVKIEGQPRRAYKDLHEGQTVETGDHTRVEFELEDRSVIRIGPNSKVNVGNMVCGKPEDRTVSMKLRIGNIMANMAHKIGGNTVFECCVDAKGGSRDTEIEASVEANGVVTMRVDEGHGFLWGGRGPSKKEVNLEAGFCSSEKPGEPPSDPYLCKPFFIWEE